MFKQGLNILAIAAIFLSGLAKSQDEQNKKSSKSDIRHIIYLIGDAGHPENDVIEIFELLKKQVQSEGVKSTVVFLGDNIYPGGMPDKDEKGWEEMVSPKVAKLIKERCLFGFPYQQMEFEY